jgi:hypothetical protein
LWRSVAGVYQLRPDELAVLREACRIADTVARLEAALADQPVMVAGSMGQQVTNPLFAELRMQRQALAGLLRQLRLPDLEGSARGANQHREAAQARWARAHGAGS